MPRIHLEGGRRRSLPGAPGNRHYHLKIALYLARGGGRRSCRLGFTPGFQKQLRLLQQPLPQHWPAVPPSAIKFSRFASTEVKPGKGVGQALAIGQAHLGHRRQILRSHLCRDLALPHLLLDALWQPLNQRQPPRHPTDAAIKLPRQLFQSVAATLFQFGQQPAFLQHRQMRAHLDRTDQHQCLGRRQRPDHGFNGIAPELFKGGDPFVAVDHHIQGGLIGGHHHDRRLLPRRRQRCHQPPLALGRTPPQILIAPFELVKLQSHRQPSCTALLWTKSHLVLRPLLPMSAANPNRFSHIRLDLVLRRLQQNFPHNPNEISSLHRELVLRQVPG